MAETVGLVVGVVSFGVQLAESLQKVKRFYNTVKDAPERLEDIIDEIGSLSDILTDLEQDSISSGTHTGPAMQRCITACRKAVDRFSTYANSLGSRMKRSKRVGSVKFAMKNESIESVIASLESSKSNLVLAYLLYREAIADKRARLVQEQMDVLASGQALLLQQPDTSQDTQLTMDKRPVRQSHRQTYVRSQPIIKTPTWLSHTVWEMAVDRAISGWTFSLRSYSFVCMTTSPLVDACISGELARIQRYFDRREASPFDEVAMSFRMSLLDLAAQWNQMEIARLLVRYGTTSLEPWALTEGWGLATEDIKLQRESFRFLIENTELVWIKEDTFPWGMDPAYATDAANLYDFVYGCAEESVATFFWIQLSSSNWIYEKPYFNLDTMALDGDTLYLLKYGKFDDTIKVDSLA